MSLEEQFVERARQLYRRDSQAAEAWLKLGEEEMATAQVLGNDIPYEFEQPHHYITDVEERQRLFSEIQPLISQTVDVNSTALAVFMVIPLSEMRPLVERLAEYDPSSIEDVDRFKSSSTYISLISYLQLAPRGIATFLAKQTTIAASKTPSATTTPESATKKRKREVIAAQPETPSPLQKRVLFSNAEGQPIFELGETARQKTSPISPSLPKETDCPPDSPATRSRHAVKKAKTRDGHICILTGTDSPEAAHIYPFSADERSGRTIYLNMLISFWGKDKAEAWSSQYLKSRVTESPKNLLCLNRQLHFWWGKCRLALKPLRTLDPCTIKVQLHWLRRSITKPKTVSDGSFDDISSLCGGENDYQSWGQPPVAHRKSGLPLRTGQIFTIRAEDPEDLPSFELLEMQWDLQRIAAMSGAAEPEDNSFGEEEDEDEDGGDYMQPHVLDDDVEELDLYRTEEYESKTA
ncbi:hypothetical protein SEPCBS119000_005738 [Sporothrix epigloea]|uniref:HNH nuclease domain-containing protein n=1 Tax=Sporothrix epigloea TaxID=1892477 RepID=A0ABP0DZF7_9PEZI